MPVNYRNYLVTGSPLPAIEAGRRLYQGAQQNVLAQRGMKLQEDREKRMAESADREAEIADYKKMISQMDALGSILDPIVDEESHRVGVEKIKSAVQSGLLDEKVLNFVPPNYDPASLEYSKSFINSFRDKIKDQLVVTSGGDLAVRKGGRFEKGDVTPSMAEKLAKGDPAKKTAWQGFFTNNPDATDDQIAAFSRKLKNQSPLVNLQIGEKSMTKLGEKMSEALVAERKDVEGAISSIDTLRQAKGLLDAGMITGTGAEFITNVGNLLSSRLGFKQAEDPVANTQAFAAIMGRQVAQVITAFGTGTGLSDADREYATKIAGGDINLNEKAIRWLIKAGETASKNLIKRFNKKAEQVMSKSGSGELPYDLRIDYDVNKPETPPIPGAKKAPDGNWYIEKDGQFYQVSDLVDRK